MAFDDETRDDSLRTPTGAQPKRPGVVVLLEGGRAVARTLPVPKEGLELGRGAPSGLFAEDDRASRRHARITRRGEAFEVADLGSRNGTFLSGALLEGARMVDAPALVRMGHSLLWLVDDLTPFEGQAVGVSATGSVLGGRTRRAWGEIALMSRAGSTLCLRGESGSGKELAARVFHEARFGADSKAPFVAVNCASIPEGLAERLLFGAQRGAFSGATSDAEGYLQAADGGTLFLDEIAELDAQVQAKLLRVMESREVLALGATRPRKVELAVCVASFKSLRDEVAAGRFREDLYFRIGRPEVVVPPLRERLDELPELISRELGKVARTLVASASFVESCALRPWPGNVRELLGEVRRAGHAALAAHSDAVEPEHLAHDAGRPLSAAPGALGGKGEPRTGPAAMPSDEQIREVLAQQAGNVRGSARALGMHRNQLRRWLEKHPHELAEAARDPLQEDEAESDSD